MSYKVVVTAFPISILITYFSLYICNYINKNDNQNIRCSNITKITLSIINSILVILLFIKYSLSIYCLLYLIVWSILFITAYVDYCTKYVYEVTSRPLIIIASIILITNLLSGVTNLSNAIWLLISFLVVILFGKLKYIGLGDIEVFLSAMMILNNFKISLVLLIFSFGISGIASIFMLVIKKVGLEHRKPLCPSIAVATYLILILM